VNVAEAVQEALGKYLGWDAHLHGTNAAAT
jgi:hypothetical protein